MELLIGGRGGGKTTQLFQWILDAPEGVVRVIACRDLAQVKWMRERLAHLKLEDWQIITHDEAAQGTSAIWHRMAGPNVEVAIDDLQVFVGKHIRSNVALMAIEGHPFEKQEVSALLTEPPPYVPSDGKNERLTPDDS
jgi:hypothetical protein